MIFERRDFLKLLGLTAGSVGMGSCGGRWSMPDNLVEMALRGPGLSSDAQSICGLCQSGCGLTVRLVDGLPVGLKGSVHHPLNRGGLCPVGMAGLDVLYSPDRLQGPLKRNEAGSLVPVDWDEALGQIADRMSGLLQQGRGDRMAVLLGPSDELFLDLAEAFAGLLDSPNVAEFQQGTVVPYRLSQGIEEIPAIDFAGADMVLSLGNDLFEDGPAPLQSISALVGEQVEGERAALIYVGTRLSPSATKAKRQVWIRPGTYPAFALGVAHVLVREGRYDREFVAEHTLGFDDWTDENGREHMGFRRLLMERYYPDRVAQLCGVEASSIVQVARMFSEGSKPVAVAGGGATSGTNATWTVLAVQAINALTGAFGRAGGVKLSPPIPLRRMANSPPIRNSATNPMQALTERLLAGSEEIEVLLIAGCDPVHDSPVGDRLREAMAKIPLVVALTPFLNDTARSADLVLAAHAPLEDWRASTTPPGVPFSVLGIAEPVVEPLYETRNVGDVLLELGKRASEEGESALPWANYQAYLEDRVGGVAASGEGAIVTGSFEEGWKHFLEERGWRFTEARRPEDFWRDLVQQAGWWNPVQPQEDWTRLFPAPSGRYEFFSQALERRLRDLGALEGDVSADDGEALARGARSLGLQAEGDEICLPHYEPPLESGEGELVLVPFRPITARGNLGSHSAMLMEMFGYPVLSGWETWAEITEETAHGLDVGDGDIVALESDRSTIEVVVRVMPTGSQDVVHVPVGLGIDDDRARGGRVGSNPIELVVPEQDVLSGELSLSSTRVRMRLIRRRPHGGPVPRHGGHAA
jgi:anaerobic selenocysteine-containing dehydrogenase